MTTHDPRQRLVDARGAVVGAFASSYGRYLDGRLPVTALADATATTRARAGPPIPAASRAGSLAVAYIHRSANGVTIGYRDRAHSFAAQLALGRRGRHWQITQLVAPDLDSILHGGRPIPLTRGSEAAANTARRFLHGYLPWLYSRARPAAIHAASARLIAQFQAHPPRVPITLRSVHPRLIALGTERASGGWRVLANITAGQQTYELAVTVVPSRVQWRVIKVNARF